MAPFDLRLVAFLLLTTLPVPALAGDVSVKLDSGAGFSVKDNTGAVERLRVDVATGNVSRNGALFVHTTGTNNTFVGVSAGSTSTTGSGNAGFGRLSLRSNTTGTANAAFGNEALYSNTAGSYNAACSAAALRANTTGNWNSAVGFRALFLNSTGSENSAFGAFALVANTASSNSAFGMLTLASNTTGTSNTAVGSGALTSNTTGLDGSAVGVDALRNNTTGWKNSALGTAALRSNTTGSYNTALGTYALQFNTNVSNTAVGYAALRNGTTGSRNAALGKDAGSNQTTGNDNIYLANTGVAGENQQIKIGTVGTHTQTTIAGISGATSSGGVAVLVNASGVLGTTTSSARFKQDVRDMGDASDVLMKLRPVVFRYREDVVGAEDSKQTQYGLIAEEVEQVAPELVAPDLEGKPYSVKYHELPALLLNELQQQRQEIAALRERLAKLEAR